MSPVDRAHSAFADLGENLVVSDGAPSHLSGSCQVLEVSLPIVQSSRSSV